MRVHTDVENAIAEWLGKQKEDEAHIIGGLIPSLTDAVMKVISRHGGVNWERR